MKSIFKQIIVKILIWESKLVLRKYQPKIVAITGSVGKTSTKDAVFSVFSNFFFTRKSEKSYNSEIGVPLTILGCPNGWNNPYIWIKNIFEGLALILLPNRYPKWLILEIGADRPGDIKSLAQWIHPDICIVTRLSKVPVHVEYFKSALELYKEKGNLVEALKKDGTLILNSDDEDVLDFRNLFQGKTFLYGKESNAQVIGTGYEIIYEEKENISVPSGVSFNVSFGNDTENIKIFGGLGIQQMYPALAACAAAISEGFSLNDIAKAFKSYEATRGRMKIISGVKNTTIIDDSYNSSPVALEEALNTLALIRTKGRKIAVLGDMLELGTHSANEHKKVGDYVAKTVSCLITVGVRARAIAEGALNNGLHEEKIFQFEDSREAGKHLEILLKSGDIVLIKGSQGMRMEKAVEEVMAEPMEKRRLLVRQDEEWQKR